MVLPCALQEKVASIVLPPAEHTGGRPGFEVMFCRGNQESPPTPFRREHLDLLLTQLRDCPGLSTGNMLVFAPPPHELERRGYYCSPLGYTAPRDSLSITIHLQPGADWGAGESTCSWPDARKWVVDLRRPGASAVLLARAGSTPHTPEAELQPWFVCPDVLQIVQPQQP